MMEVRDKILIEKSECQVRTLAKPVLKWAGGKTSILRVLQAYYPKELGISIRHYIEPFFGGGAVFFDLYNKNLIDKAVILDSNPDLILLYKIIQKQPKNLIEALEMIQEKYFALEESEREKFFYEIRTVFNDTLIYISDSLRAAYIIFLNRTCFNGLFRLNKKGEFNVPFGRYKNPRILDKDNIYVVSKALEICDIIQGDFTQITKYVQKNSFIYYDPPYKPLSKTSAFTAYSGSFDDNDQIRLNDFYKTLGHKNIKQMLSNSDPLTHSGDDFFDRLYKDFYIHRILAKRMINSSPDKRGKISEVLITNYETD